MLSIALVGATGLVGQTMLQLLDEETIPFDSLTLYSSARSAGKEVTFQGSTYTVEELTEEAALSSRFDYVLMSAGGDISLTYAPLFEKTGAVVIDNSSAWRMDPAIDLIVPEVNKPSLKRRIIANPNCSTIQSVVPLKPLADRFGLSRVAYTTYQSVSGSGWKGIEDLDRGEKGEAPENYDQPIYHNVIPQIDVFMEDGYTKEEQKMIKETQKILNDPELDVTATCVRVPVPHSHAVAMNVTLKTDVSVDALKEALSDFPSIVLMDDPESALYPTPLDAAHKKDVFIGRIRKDPSLPKTYHIWSVSDNILKGAAWNAVQILIQLINGKED
ncbi:Aspartate-semialdehyde dehydrogenase [Alkalibacterium sp. AK22]|uniref:aspartate-semialdehyde dehydrogenase n=1 Tax=Alkalibacterium sp. AK22 TaxID=1229520 RepID=UPI000452543F|nr:aspartate-semialdehyde dehydrogenase [Alkalibacterium sp. AK22]EXJ22573.1 Aspartate-semialdehyde dehydrogenase [Alkalibacterium sp. AK22]